VSNIYYFSAQSDADIITNEDDPDDDNVSLKLVSAKDYLDDDL